MKTCDELDLDREAAARLRAFKSTLSDSEIALVFPSCFFLFLFIDVEATCSVTLVKDYYIDGRNTRFCQFQLGEDFKL